jgi:uncharacterized protein YggE
MNVPLERGYLRHTPEAVLLALIALLAGCAATTGPADTAPRLISTRGVGKVAVKPDLAVVRVGAETRAPTVADATADVARRMDAVLIRIKALGVAERDVTTVLYSIDPVAAPRRTEEDPSRIVAYHVANVAQVKIRDLAAAGRILDGALGAGANTISALQFTIDDPRPAEAEARAMAVKVAAATAQQLATAAGVRLGEVVSVTEGSGVRPPVGRVMLQSAAAPAMSAGPIESGQYEVVVSVEAHYRIH